MEHMLGTLSLLVGEYGLWVVFFGVMLEGTTMIIVTGILCYLGMLSFLTAVIVAILGAIIGDQFWYFVGKNYTARILDYFPSLKPKIEKLEPSVQNRGALLAFSGRFIYSGAILFPMTLGVYRYLHKQFTIFDTMGVTLWSFTGISIGYILGTSAELVFGKIEKVWHFVLILAFIIFIAWVIKKYLLIKKHTL